MIGFINRTSILKQIVVRYCKKNNKVPLVGMENETVLGHGIEGRGQCPKMAYLCVYTERFFHFLHRNVCHFITFHAILEFKI